MNYSFLIHNSRLTMCEIGGACAGVSFQMEFLVLRGCVVIQIMHVFFVMQGPGSSSGKVLTCPSLHGISRGIHHCNLRVTSDH